MKGYLDGHFDEASAVTAGSHVDGGTRTPQGRRIIQLEGRLLPCRRRLPHQDRRRFVAENRMPIQVPRGGSTIFVIASVLDRRKSLCVTFLLRTDCYRLCCTWLLLVQDVIHC